MMPFLRFSLALILACGASSSALAEDKLDLPLYSPLKPPPKKDKDIPPIPKDLWAPGNPLNDRGLTREEQAIGIAGNAGLAAAGFAQAAPGIGKNRDDDVLAAGFGAILLLQLWKAWKFVTDPESRR